ncbi:hypothetical protein RGU72_12975 [Undibacterium sp. 5I1]|uniref:hypothetical protein n=1 Tax=unclassified Undibacterium TaxID=2630295 RepID=UPI002AB56E20|nr:MULTISPECIES: hypothetical protein [unclassified Undibacterium]MDY7539166.1 hypothetical protein [Undibacterium sp. 5I1]MEB0232406.1 hypothetical protein [Undibacterium sp. 10I3]MEB0257036.1 hypothetical protein [Undibacterium sp. 5I1]
MDYALAKVKGRLKTPFFKLVSDLSLFDTIAVNLPNCIQYNPDHNLDEDSWFKVEQFSQQTYCIDLLKKVFDSKDYDDLKKAQFIKIAYVFSVQGDDFYFQKISPSLFIRRKTLVFGEVAEVQEGQDRLVINTQPDAVYFKASDTLIFRNLATISSIFTGIDELYKEATNAEVKQFLEESFIELTADYNEEKVSKPNRKRIALAAATLATMSDQEKSNMHTYVESYCGGKLKFDDKASKFEISNDEELKFLLYGIEQRFYTTPFGKEKRLANSVVALG